MSERGHLIEIVTLKKKKPWKQINCLGRGMVKLRHTHRNMMQSSKATLLEKKIGKKIYWYKIYCYVKKQITRAHVQYGYFFFLNEHIQRIKKRFLCINCLTVVISKKWVLKCFSSFSLCCALSTFSTMNIYYFYNQRKRLRARECFQDGIWPACIK